MTNDLISRSELKRVIETYRPIPIKTEYSQGKNNMIDYCIAEIDAAPTVDAIVNTIEERPQGEWIRKPNEHRVDIICTNCGYDDGYMCFKYCPNCGADMRKGGAE